MIVDTDGTVLELVGHDNDHILTTGISGQGKTYFNVRLLEEAVSLGKSIVVLDEAHSFQLLELQEKKCTVIDRLKFHNLKNEEYVFTLSYQSEEDAGKQVASAFIDALGIEQTNSFNQRKLLMECCTNLLKFSGEISFPGLVESLSEIIDDNTRKRDERDNSNRLLGRLFSVQDMFNFLIVIGDKDSSFDKEAIILQLSDLPPEVRKLLSGLILALIWREVEMQQDVPRYDVVLFDEFQDLPFHKDSSLEFILRQSRKHKLQLILSTQHLKSFNTSQITTLQQASTKVYFKPTDYERGQIARSINTDQANLWASTLQHLKRGEAVLQGTYRIKGRSKLLSSPVLVRIMSDIQDSE